jgi:transcriptional regulator with XRE-family HTH domain
MGTIVLTIAIVPKVSGRMVVSSPVRSWWPGEAPMATNSHPSFAALLKGYRQARGLTQEALAAAAGLSRDAINLLERGARRSPRHDTVARLARALKLSSDERTRLLGARASVPTAREPASPSPLPARLTSFVGREQEIAEVKALLVEKRLATLCGPGGIGKTSLALVVAREAQSRFADGVALVDLAALVDGEMVPHAAAAVLGVRERLSEPILTTLGRTVGTAELLLVLDNCEHLLLGCARVAEALLQACPRLRILATSREPLRVGAEIVWRVPALTLPRDDRRPFEELAQSEAVYLFVDRARAVRPAFTLIPENVAAVVEICCRLDGIPLAIELAAARVSALTPEELAHYLSDCFRILTSGSRTALPRHQTLWAAIDWSHDLLPEKE